MNVDEPIVCPQKCWPCISGHHMTPPEWHTWADFDDAAHAIAHNLPDPTTSRCGCWCGESQAGAA